MKSGSTPLLCSAATVAMRTPPSVTLPPKRARIESAGLPPFARSLAAKKDGMSLPVTIFDFLASAMSTTFVMRRRHRAVSGLAQLPAAHRLDVGLADVVVVHVADQDDVDPAQARIVAAGHGMARVVEDARPVRVLEDQRAILRAELAVDALPAA